MTNPFPVFSAAVRQWMTSAPLLGLTRNRRGDWSMGALENGHVVVLPSDDAGENPQDSAAHEGSVTAFAPDSDDHAFLSGGADGRVLLIDPLIEEPTLLAFHPEGQIACLASSPCGGARAYGTEDAVFLLDETGTQTARLALPSGTRPNALAFSPQGDLLALGHKGGVSVFSLSAPDKPLALLAYEGEHNALLWRTKSLFLFSSLKGGGIHGWPLDQGLPPPEHAITHTTLSAANATASLWLTAQETFLATNGAERAVCWPLTDTGGPIRQKPLLLGGEDGRLVTRIAPHPNEPLVAIGYDDGRAVLAPLDGRKELFIQAPTGAPVVGMAWSPDGNALSLGLASGLLALFTQASVTRFLRGQRA